MGHGKLDYPALFSEQVALGLVDGVTAFRKFGNNPAVSGTNTQEDVWNGPVAVRVLPTSAAVAAVVSTDADDTSAGSGAQTVRVEGLDENYLEISETVSMTGATPVNTTQTFLRVNRAFVVTAGTTATNEGSISVSVGGDVQAVINAAEGQTAQTQYTVPSDKYLLVNSYHVQCGRMGGNTDLHVEGQIKLFGGAWRSITNVYLWDGASWQNDFSVTLIPPKTELRIQTQSSVATQLSGVFGGYLIRTNYLNQL